jgi:hypothetical protein
MATSHNRRLDKLEEVSRPKGRVVFIWNNHKPGCVEREKERLTETGSLSPQHRIVTIGWLQ